MLIFRRSLPAALLAALALVLNTSAVPAQTLTPPLTTIRVASTPDDTFVVVLYAQRSGMFRQAGLDVQIQPQATSGAAIAAGVASGAFDIGKSSLTSLLIAHQRSIPFTLVAPGTLYDPKAPYGLLIVPHDSTAKSGKDLNGTVISVAALNGLDQVAISAWVDENGGDSKTLKFIELPQSEAGAALDQHRIAAALVVRPQLDAALDSGQARVLAPAFNTVGNNFLVSAWFTTTDFATKHSDAVQKFARVIAQAAAYGNGHHAETAPLLAEAAKIPVATIEKMVRGVLGTQLTPNLVQPVINISAKYGQLARIFPADEIIYKPSGGP